MALLFAHIIFQIRRGFRSRIFFELKIPFLPDYDALCRNQPAPTQSVWSEILNYTLRTGYDAQRLYRLGAQLIQPKPDASGSLVTRFIQQPISPNQNYI
jgi:hypothetical protein